MPETTTDLTNVPDAHGRFGPYGGQYVPETLMGAVHQLETEYEKARPWV